MKTKSINKKKSNLTLLYNLQTASAKNSTVGLTFHLVQTKKKERQKTKATTKRERERETKKEEEKNIILTTIKLNRGQRGRWRVVGPSGEVVAGDQRGGGSAHTDHLRRRIAFPALSARQTTYSNPRQGWGGGYYRAFRCTGNQTFTLCTVTEGGRVAKSGSEFQFFPALSSSAHDWSRGEDKRATGSNTIGTWIFHSEHALDFVFPIWTPTPVEGSQENVWVLGERDCVVN